MQKDISKIPKRFFVWLTFEGYFFNFFLPSSVGGDVFKALKLGSHGAGKLNAATATFLSRIFGVFILCLFFWIGMLFRPQTINVLLLILMLITSTTSFLTVLLLLIQPLQITFLKKFHRLYTTIEIYRGKWKLFSITLLKTVILQLCILASQYTFFKSINIDISISYLFLYSPLINIATMIPLSFNGIGIREWAIVETFATIPGITIESCMASTAIAYTVVFMQAGIGALCYILPVPLTWRNTHENKLRKN